MHVCGRGSGVVVEFLSVRRDSQPTAAVAVDVKWKRERMDFNVSHDARRDCPVPCYQQTSDGTWTTDVCSARHGVDLTFRAATSRRCSDWDEDLRASIDAGSCRLARSLLPSSGAFH